MLWFKRMWVFFGVGWGWVVLNMPKNSLIQRYYCKKSFIFLGH